MIKELLWVRSFCFSLLLLLTVTAVPVAAQSTAFSYQGKLADNGNPANGSFDMQFKLFDVNGNQIGATLTFDGTAGNPPSVVVSNGIFAVSLDFGTAAFPGADRFLEIAVKPHGSGSYTTLTPRQLITSAPYALKSANATTADGLSAAASANFIQNGTSQQTGDFNISGSAAANLFDAATQYNLNGSRVLSVSGGNNQFQNSNTFAGIAAGMSNTPSAGTPSGNYNSFYGRGAGQSNTTGGENSFFGAYAGDHNTTGNGNSFFGDFAGEFNTTGSTSSFFGSGAGFSNTTGSANSFFGQQAGNSNSTGAGNAFFGTHAGLANTTGNSNSFFGSSAGYKNTTGVSNTFIGAGADFNASNPTGDNNTLLGYNTQVTTGVFNSTAIGAFATVTQSNSLVLGAITGINVGIGTTSPSAALDVVGGAQPMRWARAGAGKTWAWEVDASGTYIRNATDVTLPLTILNGGNVGIGTTTPQYKLHLRDNSATATALLIENTSSAGQVYLVSYGSTGAGNYWTGQPSADTTGLTTQRPFVLSSSGGMIFSGSSAGEHMRITPGGNVGIGTTAPAFKLHVNGEIRADMASVGTYVSGGTIQVCVNTSNNRLRLCNSSLRYKTAVQPFTAGLTIINRLQPISYRWKESGLPDIGLAAEAVEKVEPLLTFRNDKGEVDGVKYNQLSAIFINAFKEQQAQITQLQTEIATLRHELRQVKQQKELIRQQQQEMATIKQLLCASHPRANLCKAKPLK